MTVMVALAMRVKANGTTPLGAFLVGVKLVVRALHLAAEGIKPLINVGSELIKLVSEVSEGGLGLGLGGHGARTEGRC
jgi:hypothetical protein